MAEMVHHFGDNVRHLPLEKAHFRVRPSANLEVALRQYVNPESKLAQSALFLYSEPMLVKYTGGKTLQVNNLIQKRLGETRSSQHRLAQAIHALRTERQVSIGFTALLDPAVQRRMHEFHEVGLDQLRFGRKALEVAFVLPFDDVVSSENDRRTAALAIRQAVWGDGRIESSALQLHPPKNGGSYVTDMQWIVKR